MFALQILGDVVLSGVPRPSNRLPLLAKLAEVYEEKTGSTWKVLVQVAQRYSDLNSWRKREEPRLPFPRWWEDEHIDDFNLSQWVHENLAKGVRCRARSSQIII